MPAMAPDPWHVQYGNQAFADYLRTMRITDAEIRAILRDAANEARRRIAALADSDNIGAVARRAQYAQSQLALQQVQAQLWASVQSSITQGLQRATLLSVTQQRELLRLLSLAIPDADAAFLQGMLRAAEQAAERVRLRVLARIDLSQRVYQNQALMTGRVDAIVNRGIALNMSAREIARDVARFISPTTPGGVNYASMRLARTEITNSFHAVNVQSYNEQPWIEGAKWELSGSHPDHDICDEYAHDDANGLGPGVFPPRYIPSLPHPHCLCHLIPITVSRDRFSDTLLSGGYNDWLSARGLATF